MRQARGPPTTDDFMTGIRPLSRQEHCALIKAEGDRGRIRRNEADTLDLKTS
jgi:hypothetical protein